MYIKIKIEMFDEQIDQAGYVKEINKFDIYEQRFVEEEVNIHKLIKELNDFQAS